MYICFIIKSSLIASKELISTTCTVSSVQGSLHCKTQEHISTHQDSSVNPMSGSVVCSDVLIELQMLPFSVFAVVEAYLNNRAT